LRTLPNWEKVFEESKSKSTCIYGSKGEKVNVSLKDFTLIKKLGKGSFGTVYLVQNKDNGLYYAMKQQQKEALINSDTIEGIKLEKDILKACHHPFLAEMDFAFQTPSDIYFVMKYYRYFYSFPYIS